MAPAKPLVSITIAPNTPADAEKLRLGLRQLMADDRTLQAHEAPSGGVVTIGGMGERHLEIVVARLKQEFQLEASVGRLRPVYREVLTRDAEAEGRYVRRFEGRGEYAHVRLRVQPGAEGTGCVFTNEIVGGAIPPQFIEPIHEGIAEARLHGVLAAGAIDDVRVALCDGSYHDVDSTAAAFKAAAAIAFRDAAKKADPVLLEPVMSVEVDVPGDVGDVAAELGRRRGRIRAQATVGTRQVVRALVPLSELFGYAADLDSRAGGRIVHSMIFAGYEPYRGRPGSDDDRDVGVREPLTPAPGRDRSSMALPEPDDSALER